MKTTNARSVSALLLVALATAACSMLEIGTPGRGRGDGSGSDRDDGSPERWSGSVLRQLDRGEWPVVPPRPGDSADSISSTADGFALDGAVVLGSARTAIHTPLNSPPITGWVLSNLEVHSADPWPPGPGTDWLMRCYGVNNWLLEDVWFHDARDPNEGHGAYFNLYGSVTFRRCLFDDVMGQAIQIVWRPHEGPPPDPDGGVILLEDVEINNASFGAGRGAFPVSIFGKGLGAHDVILRRVTIKVEWDEPQLRSGQLVRSAGGVNVRGYHEDSWGLDEITLEDCTIILVQPRQAVAQLGSCRVLTVRGCHFVGGKVLIDHERPEKLGTGEVYWSANTGDSVVRDGPDGAFQPVAVDWSR